MAEPDLTEEEFASQQVQQLNNDDDVANCLRHLKDLSLKYPNIFDKKSIHSLIFVLDEYSSDDELISNLFTCFWNLLSDENKTNKLELAQQIIEDKDSLTNFIKAIFSKNHKKRIATLKLISRLTALQPSVFQQQLADRQEDMVKFLSCINDKDEEILEEFIKFIPVLINKSADFQQVICFNIMDKLVTLISTSRMYVMDTIHSILDGNRNNQKMFVDSGYLKNLTGLVKITDDSTFDLLKDIFSDAENAKELNESLATSGLIQILMENILKNSQRVKNMELLTIMIKGNEKACEIVSSKLESLIALFISDTLLRETLTQLFVSYLTDMDISTEYMAKSVAVAYSKNQVPALFDLCTLAILCNPKQKGFFDDFFAVSFDAIGESLPTALRFATALCFEYEKGSNLFAEGAQKPITKLIPLFINETTRKDVRFLIALLISTALQYKSEENDAPFLSNISTLVFGEERIEEALLNGESESNSKWNEFEAKLKEILNKEKPVHRASLLNVGDGDSKEKIKTLQKENEKLMKKVDSLEKEKEEKEGKLNDLQSIKNDNENEIKKLNEKLSEAGKEAEELREEKENLKEEINAVKESKAESESEEVKELNSRINSLTEQMNSLEKEYSKKEEEHKKQIEEIEEEHKKQIEELNEKHKKQIEEIEEEHKKQIEELNEEHKKNEEEIEEKYSKKEEDLKAENKKKEEDINEENSKKENELEEEHKKKEEELNEEIKQKEEEISLLNEKLEEYKNKVENSKEIEAKLEEEKNEEIEKLKEEFKEFKEKSEESEKTKDSTIEVFDQKIEELIKENNKLHENINELEEKVKNTEEAVDETVKDYEKEIEDLKEKNKNEIQEKERKISMITKQKEIAEEELSKAQANLDELCTTLKKQPEEQRDVIQKLEQEKSNELSAVKLALAKQEQDNQNITEELNELKQRNQKISSDVDSLQQKLSNEEKEKQEIEAEANSCKEKIEELSSTIESLTEENNKLIESNNELETMKEEIDQLKNENLSLQNNIKEMKEREEEIEDNLDEANKANEENAKIKEEIEKLKKEKESKSLEDKFRISELERKLKESEDKIDIKQQKIRELIKEKFEIEEENNKNLEEIEELNKQLKREENSTKTIASAIDQIKASNSCKSVDASNDLAIENEILKAQLEKCQKQQKEAENRIAELTKERNNDKDDTESSEEDEDDIDEKIRKLIEENEEKSSKIEIVKKQLSSTTEKLNRSKEEVIELNKKLKAESTRLTDKFNKKLNDLKSKMGNELKIAKAKNIEYEAKLTNAINSGDIITVKETPEEMLKEVNDLRKTVLSFDKENQKLTNENNELRSRLDQQKSASQPLNEENARTINILQLKIERLQSRLEKEKKRAISYKESDIFEQKYLDATADLSTVQHEKNELIALIEKMKAKAKFNKQMQSQETKKYSERIKSLESKLEEANKLIQVLQESVSKLKEQSKNDTAKLCQLEHDNARLINASKDKTSSIISIDESLDSSSIQEQNNTETTTEISTEDASDYKRALRLIGKMWLLQQNSQNGV